MHTRRRPEIIDNLGLVKEVVHVESCDTKEVGDEVAREVSRTAAPQEVDRTAAVREAGRIAAVLEAGRTATGGRPRTRAEVAPDMVVGRKAASGKQPRERVGTTPDTTA